MLRRKLTARSYAVILGAAVVVGLVKIVDQVAHGDGFGAIAGLGVVSLFAVLAVYWWKSGHEEIAAEEESIARLRKRFRKR